MEFEGGGGGFERPIETLLADGLISFGCFYWLLFQGRDSHWILCSLNISPNWPFTRLFLLFQAQRSVP